MPADVKTHPAAGPNASLMGVVFTFQSEAERVDGIDKAFDYRGDVTLTLVNGTIEGYIFNRDASISPPRIEMFVKGSDAPVVIPYADITAIAFTGKDPADGKSWANWVNKKEDERQAEAERIRLESEAQGHL